MDPVGDVGGFGITPVGDGDPAVDREGVEAKGDFAAEGVGLAEARLTVLGWGTVVGKRGGCSF